MGQRSEDGPALERRLLGTVSRRLQELELAQSNQPIIAAVSGGPDSMALLLLLAELEQPMGLRLHVAHLNHGLRGGESKEDALFVEETARHLNLAITVEQVDVESHRRGRHISLEEAAREVRYEFLSRVAADQGACAVALGHTADDQAETILMHILRGSGLAGLAGMSTLSYWSSAQHSQRTALVRPLLEIAREETESYCRFKGVAPREDSSNISRRFVRNRLRSDLLPRLKEFNPRFQEALLRLGRSAAQDQAYILGETFPAKERLSARDGEDVVIDREGFSALPATLKVNLLRLAYQEILGTSQELEHGHLEEMLKLSRGGAGKRIALPFGLVFSVGHSYLRLGPGGSEVSRPPIVVEEYPLTVPGEMRIPGWTVNTRLSLGNEVAASGGELVARLDGACVGYRLLVRGRRPGDRFQPLGMTGSKKLQDFMVDARIPHDMRDRVPLVLSEGRIAWVVGHRIAHWARVREDTKKTVEMEFTPSPVT